MIVVVEGISAAGKTTWCRAHAPHHLVPETFPADRKSQPETGMDTARYWTDWNAKRWGDALSLEAAKGYAVCDTDPLKLHYIWCLHQIGMASKTQWTLQRQATRTAFSNSRLGFADMYFVKIIDPMVARRQSDADTTRVRDRFDLHVRLQPALVLWYELLDQAIGGRVRWTLPDDGLVIDPLFRNGTRYDLDVFATFMSLLDANSI